MSESDYRGAAGWLGARSSVLFPQTGYACSGIPMRPRLLMSPTTSYSYDLALFGAEPASG